MKWLKAPRCAVCSFRVAVIHIAGEGRCAKHAPAWALAGEIPGGVTASLFPEAVPATEQCHRTYPTFCHARATHHRGPFQWCDDHAPGVRP